MYVYKIVCTNIQTFNARISKILLNSKLLLINYSLSYHHLEKVVVPELKIEYPTKKITMIIMNAGNFLHSL